jgi:hypothetical protein
MQINTINKLYLELSQIATAKTARELALEKELARVDAELWRDEGKPKNYEPDRALRLRAIMKLSKANARRARSA